MQLHKKSNNSKHKETLMFMIHNWSQAKKNKDDDAIIAIQQL